MKRLTALLLAGALVAVLCSCGGKPVQQVNAMDLKQAMLAADPSLPEMKTASSADDTGDLFTQLFDLPYEKVSSYFFAYSAQGTADEIGVIVLKQESDGTDALTAVQGHIADRVKLYTNYKPEEVKRAQAATVFQSGPYVVLLMCEQQQAVETVFRQAVQPAPSERK